MKTLARPTATATNSIIELTAAALPTQHQLGALPFQDLTRKNGLVTPGRRRNLADPCDRLAGGASVPRFHPPGRFSDSIDSLNASETELCTSNPHPRSRA